MQVVRNQDFKCWECERGNIPVLRLMAGILYLYLCQKCILEAFSEFAKKAWKEKLKKGNNA